MSDTDFFLNQTGGSVSQQLGTRLNNFKNQVLSTQSVIGIQPDNSTDAIPYTAFGKSLLSVSTLNGLVGLINSADTQVQVIDSGTGEINFTLDNQLKLVVKNLYTEVLNELRSLNIIPATDLEYNLGTLSKRYNTGFIRKITTNSVGQVSIGDGTGTGGISSVNIGNGSGGSGEANYSVSIGRGANSEQSHSSSICLGYAAGQKGTQQRSGIVAIGHSAGTGITGVQGMLNNAIAIGASASLNGGAVDSIALGAGANGNSVANDYSIAIGSGAGSAGQGNHCIAIGRLAGSANQHNNTIIINGQNNTALNSGQANSLYIAPIRSGGTGNTLVYDTGSKEVLVGGVASMAGITTSGHISPDATNQRDLGASGTRFRTLYTTDVSVNGNIYSSTTTTPIILAQDTTERARINASGQLEVKTATISTGAIKISTPSQSLNETTFIGFSGDGSDGNDRARVGCRFGSSGGGNLFFTTGGSGTQADRMVITDTGVGIGTTPASNYILDVRRTGADAYSRISGDVGQKQGLIFSDGPTPTDIWTFYKKQTTKTLNIYNNTTSSDTMTFTSTNQVGINCTPLASSTLEVRGSSASSYLRIAGAESLQQALLFTDTSDRWAWYKPANTTDLRLYNYVSTNPKDLMTFTQTNLVGINTATPVYNLHINASGTSAFAGSDKKGLLITDSTVPRILLENLGNTSGQRLSAIQNISNIWSVGVLGDTGGSWNKERILGLNLSTYDATFAGDILTDSVGDKDIGSTSNPFGKLHTIDADISNLVVNCKTRDLTPNATNTYTIGSSSSTQYNAIYGNTVYGNGIVLTSDINKKKDIQPIEDALSVIMRFESKSFKFKDGTSNRKHTGFIAQQIKEVVPDDWALYCDNKLGDIGLKYTEVIPLNTRAIQQLNERLTKVESRKLVGGSVIDTSGLTEDFVRVYERLDFLESEVNKPVKPQLHRCVEISRINELFDRISNLECNESKSNSSEDFELIHSLMEKNHSLEMKVNELSDKLVVLETKLESRSNVESKSIDFLAESDGGLNMNEILQTKNYELEQRILKLEKQNKKLVQAVNRLLKTTDE